MIRSKSHPGRRADGGDFVCFKLFDQVPRAPAKIAERAKLNDVFGKQASRRWPPA